MLRLPDPEGPPEPMPSPRRSSVRATARGNGSSASARNPLFRAIDGGLVDTGAEERPPPRRGSARRARPAVAPARQGRAERVPPPEDDGGGHMRPECYACPVGLAFNSVREASPETLDHLVSASRELVSAARSVMQALETSLERHSRQAPVQRIELD